jgi:hypothetical protein
MTIRYICCRCDTRAEVSVGRHLCRAPSNDEIDAAIAERLRRGHIDEDGAWRSLWQWSCVFRECVDDLSPIATSRGYRFTLTQLGADEYRVSFFCNIDTIASTALDRTPARAFARAFLRIPEE